MENEIQRIFKKANYCYKKKEYMSSVIELSKIFSFNKQEYYHKAYWGLYLAWWNLCKIKNHWDYDIDKFYNNALLNAPTDEIKESYHKIYNYNKKIFDKED